MTNEDIAGLLEEAADWIANATICTPQLPTRLRVAAASLRSGAGRLPLAGPDEADIGAEDRLMQIIEEHLGQFTPEQRVEMVREAIAASSASLRAGEP